MNVIWRGASVGNALIGLIRKRGDRDDNLVCKIIRSIQIAKYNIICNIILQHYFSMVITFF